MDGLRVLHYGSPVRFDSSGVFQHEFDSNYKVLEKTISFLPECHHYVLVPKKHTIPDNRPNVTLIKYPFYRNALSNRSAFHDSVFRNILDFKTQDIDFVFCHQPEMLYNIFVAMSDKRYGQVVSRFLFFHWVDCPGSRVSSATPPPFMRQLESIGMCDNAFFHTDISNDWLARNFHKGQPVSIDMNYIKGKTKTMPLASDPLPPAEPIELPTDKKIVVFNHRWGQTTGVNRLVEYFEGLEDEYMLWSTDWQAPPEYVAPWPGHRKLNRGQYRYLLENSHCSVGFVDGYMTWNLSVQDGIQVDKPVLVYDNPQMKKVVGDNYPYTFKTKEEFQNLIRKIPEKSSWKLDNFELTFRENLRNTMQEIIAKARPKLPQDAMNWLYCILNGVTQKSHITEQVQPHLAANSTWQYIRRWLLSKGVRDNPKTPYTNYDLSRSNIDQVLIDECLNTVKLDLKMNKRKKLSSIDKEVAWF